MNYSKTLLEALVVGIMSLVVGHVVMKLTITDKEKKNNNKQLYITFFTIGFLLHFILEIAGLNKWYCDKKCALGFQ